MNVQKIDPETADWLRHKGHTWRKVGQIMADVESRPLPYQATSVQNAVRKWRAKSGVRK
jgi:hypothetical protein